MYVLVWSPYLNFQVPNMSILFYFNNGSDVSV